MGAPDRTQANREFPLYSGCRQRVAAMVAYNGRHFHGWQRQASPAVATIQSVLEDALEKIATHPVKVHCCGRTDAGVHAVAQVVHFDVAVDRELKAWVMGANTHLPDSVRVVWATNVDTNFHARYAAMSRKYQYYIDNSPTASAIFASQLTHYRYALDHESMNRAAQFLLGEHDFSSFRAANCQSSSAMRHISAISVTRRGAIVCLEVKANAFLLHMMRNIAGALLAVGTEKKSQAWLNELLLMRDRRLAEPTAPPDGLYLQEVEYPAVFGLPRCAGDLPFS